MILRPLSLAALLGATSLIAQEAAPESPPPPVPVPSSPAPAIATPASAASLALNGNELLDSLKLPDAPLETILTTLEELTGRTVLRPAALPVANYSLMITRPMPRSEAVLALETILNMNQIGIAPMGDKFLKIVPLPNLRTEAPHMLEGSALDIPASGMVMAKIFQLNFLRVNEFVPQLNQLLNPQLGGPVMFEKTNAVLITDSVATLQRIEMLIRQLDKPLTESLTPKFYSLTHGAKASTVVNQMRTILQGVLQNQLGSATTYSADDRSNQIILIADSRQHQFFDDLISNLDVKADPNTRNEVIYLKHASSKDVATLLSQLVSGQNKANTSGSEQSVRPGQVVGPTPANAPIAPQPEGTPPATALTGLVDTTAEFSSLLTILPDERSNSVVVSGTVDDIRLITSLIDKIDIVLAQVRIEVIIAEVTLTDTDVKQGVSALDIIFGKAPNGGTSITKFAGNVGGWSFSNGVANPLTFEASLADLGAKSNVTILSAPTIVTTHNKEAEIIVGQSQPIITGSTSAPAATTTTSGLATSSQVTYKDIAIDLKVTPLIGDDGNIQLKIDQKVDDILNKTLIDGNEQPIIGRRQATSFINVLDGQMIVLGGLQRSKQDKSRQKVGFFYELPIISQLLGSRNRTNEKTELLLFIRPRVITPQVGGKDTQQQIDRLSNRDQINNYLTPTPTPTPSPKKAESPSIRRPR